MTQSVNGPTIRMLANPVIRAYSTESIIGDRRICVDGSGAGSVVKIGTGDVLDFSEIAENVSLPSERHPYTIGVFIPPRAPADRCEIGGTNRKAA